MKKHSTLIAIFVGVAALAYFLWNKFKNHPAVQVIVGDYSKTSDSPDVNFSGGTPVSQPALTIFQNPAFTPAADMIYTKPIPLAIEDHASPVYDPNDPINWTKPQLPENYNSPDIFRNPISLPVAVPDVYLDKIQDDRFNETAFKGNMVPNDHAYL